MEERMRSEEEVQYRRLELMEVERKMWRRDGAERMKEESILKRRDEDERRRGEGGADGRTEGETWNKRRRRDVSERRREAAAGGGEEERKRDETHYNTYTVWPLAELHRETTTVPVYSAESGNQTGIEPSSLSLVQTTMNIWDSCELKHGGGFDGNLKNGEQKENGDERRSQSKRFLTSHMLRVK